MTPDCLAAVAALSPQVPSLGPANSTGSLDPLLARLDRKGIPSDRAFLRLAGPFPVAGPARWSNDWHAARCDPDPHLHKGIDIFAAHGTPVVAAGTGTISQHGTDPTSGLKVEITATDGTQYFYAHLSGFAPGLGSGQNVRVGDVVGYVGTSGNARGTPPHLHFEVQPRGIAVPPKPFVDRWIDEAAVRARKWLRSTDGLEQRAIRGLDATRLTTMADPALTAPVRPASAVPASAVQAQPQVGGSRISAAVKLVVPLVLAALLLPLLAVRRRPRPSPGPEAPPTPIADTMSTSLQGSPERGDPRQLLLGSALIASSAVMLAEALRETRRPKGAG